jgi:hypothetical protein
LAIRRILLSAQSTIMTIRSAVDLPQQDAQDCATEPASVTFGADSIDDRVHLEAQLSDETQTVQSTPDQGLMLRTQAQARH